VKASQLITDHSPDRTPKVSHEQLLQYIKNKDSVGFMIAMKDHLEQQFNLIVKNRKGEKSSDE
jgi:DNA-binding GntR family transcriptional regulator